MVVLDRESALTILAVLNQDKTKEVLSPGKMAAVWSRGKTAVVLNQDTMVVVLSQGKTAVVLSQGKKVAALSLDMTLVVLNLDKAQAVYCNAFLHQPRKSLIHHNDPMNRVVIRRNYFEVDIYRWQSLQDGTCQFHTMA